MIQRIKQIWTTPAVRSILIICAVCLLLSACGGEPPTFDKEDWRIDYSNCFPCVAYEAIFLTLEKALAALIQVSCQMGMTILGLGLLFWLAFKTTSLFSLKEPNIREFVYQIATTLFKAMIVVALIYNPDQYLHFIGYYIIQPIFMFFTEISRNILISNDIVAQNLITPQDITGVSSNPNIISLFGDAATCILDIIYRIFAALYMGVGLGMTLLQQPGFVGVISGLFVLIISFIVLLTFPLNFIDAFVQVVAILILSPFVFISWIFPATKGIVKNVWGILLGSMVNIFFGCIYVSLMVYVILIFAERTYPRILGAIRPTKDPILAMEVKVLSSSFLSFAVLLIAMALLSNVIPTLTQQFTGADIQSGSIMKSGLMGLNFIRKGIKSIMTSGYSAGKATKDKIKSR